MQETEAFIAVSRLFALGLYSERHCPLKAQARNAVQQAAAAAKRSVGSAGGFNEEQRPGLVKKPNPPPDRNMFQTPKSREHRQRL